MQFIVAPGTVSNPGALEIRDIPKRFLGRSRWALPKGLLASGLFWRLVFEHALTRYAIVLAPFPIAMIFKPEWAFGLSQAPLVMFAVVLFVETYFFSIADPTKRRALVAKADIERGLDILRIRGQEVLIRIATGRDLTRDVLHLVVEQSELRRVTPLSLISVQQEGIDPEFIDLTDQEQAWLRDALFDEDFTERRLHDINVAENNYVRTVTLDTRTISAHARLAARSAAKAANTPVVGTAG